MIDIKNKIGEFVRVEDKTLRRFGAVMSIATALLFGWFSIFGERASLIAYFLAGTFFTISLIAPSALKFIYILWMFFAELLGFINSRIILFLIFYFVVTPIAFAKRLFGEDSLNRYFEKNSKTYRINPRETRSPSSMEYPY